MNILVLSWRGMEHPFAGGAEISTHEHAKGWLKKGHSVTVFSSSFKGAERFKNIDGVNYIRAGRQFIDVQVRAFFWYLFGKHSQFDIVIDQFHGLPFFTPLYVRVKKLAFIHEVAKEAWKLNQWPSPLGLLPAFLGPILEPWIFKLFYKSIPFMTVSKSTKDDLVEWGIPPNKISIIENGVSLVKIGKIPQKEKDKTVMYLGALTKDKGIEDALKVFEAIFNSDSTFNFWIVGKDNPQYKNQINNLKKMGLKIKSWGYVSEKKKFELLARAHVLLNPSIREGWGLVVIEAASMGTPTVGYKVPGLVDSVVDGRTGILCPPGSCNDLAKSVIELLANQPKYRLMRENAILRSKNFSWEKASKESLKLINSL